MQLVKYFFIIIGTAFLIVAAATWLTDKGLKKSGVDFYGKINEAGNYKEQTNLLLIGSSRVLKHLDPKIIDSVTGFNSYNYGLNAGTIKTWYNIMKYALNFKKGVKGIVLNVDYNMFDTDRDPYKNAYYYPFENKVNGLVMSNTGTADLVHRLKLFDISLYDDYAKYAALDGWLRPGRIAQGVYKGYYPNTQLNYFETIPDSGIIKKDIIFAESGFNLLDSCVGLCREKNVELVLVMAPYFKRYSPEKYFNNFDVIVKKVEKAALKYNVPFFNFTSMKISAEQQFFYNVNHLNSTGASVYTLAVADSLKKYFKGY
jgi:hypothetical protein